MLAIEETKALFIIGIDPFPWKVNVIKLLLLCNPLNSDSFEVFTLDIIY